MRRAHGDAGCRALLREMTPVNGWRRACRTFPAALMDVCYQAKGLTMKKILAATAPLLFLVVSNSVHAQAIEGWKAYRAKQTAQQADPAAPTTPESPTQPVQPTAQSGYPAAAAAYSAPVRQAPAPRGAAFVGVQGGAGKVYREVDQRAVTANAGYRWQAGDYSQVGIEAGAGRLNDTTWRGIEVPEVKFNNIGANARFNFGNSPWFGTGRLGYWRARTEDLWGEKFTVDGAYASLGVGVDIGRHFNLQLVYTSYAYSNNYDYYDDEYDVNRADTLTFGGEVRF